MPLIAVHAGAGYHGLNQRDAYLKACRDACEMSMKYLKEKCSAIDGLTYAISSLEDNYLTNAGLGSNLNSSGFVECDASVMNGSDLKWGAIGALQGIKNPITAAKSVLNEQNKKLPLGLVAPNVLVGEGARLWAINNGCLSDNLITEKSKETYNKYKRRLESVTHEDESCLIKHSRLDTVGAVCVDWEGNVASGVSSGGIALKQSGRLGQAAMMGCGCWAQNGIAVTTTGVGEHLIKTVFARECAHNLMHNNASDGNNIKSLSNAFENSFFNSPFLKDIAVDDRLAGVLALVYDKESAIAELLWGHSTVSMCIGFMSSSNNAAKAVVSQMPSQTKAGQFCTIEAKSFHL